MSLLTILLVIVVVGVIVWAIQTFLPLPASFKYLVNIIAILGVLLWILRVTGALAKMSTIHF